jgi:hypothetical protein
MKKLLRLSVRCTCHSWHKGWNVYTCSSSRLCNQVCMRKLLLKVECVLIYRLSFWSTSGRSGPILFVITVEGTCFLEYLSTKFHWNLAKYSHTFFQNLMMFNFVYVKKKVLANIIRSAPMAMSAVLQKTISQNNSYRSNNLCYLNMRECGYTMEYCFGSI